MQTFACPECAAEVHPGMIGPARQVRCVRCGTLLEVPFFPRARRQKTRRRSWLVPSTWTALSLIVLLVAGISAIRLRAALWRSTRERTQARVAGLSRAEVEAQIAGIEAQTPGDPESALGLASVLLEQLPESDMPELAERVRSLRTQARIQWVEKLLKDAHACLTAEPAHSVAVCETVIRVAANLPPGRSSEPIKEAQALAATVAENAGVVLDPAHGRFVLGSPQFYDATLHPRLAEALRSHGYVPLAAGSPFRDLWHKQAAYRMTIEVTEEQRDHYLQSPNRTSQVAATFSLLRDQAPVWSVPVSGRTQVPLPNLRAFEDSRLAISNKHSPDVEHRFHQNAVNQMLERLALKLRDLPRPRPGRQSAGRSS